MLMRLAPPSPTTTSVSPPTTLAADRPLRSSCCIRVNDLPASGLTSTTPESPTTAIAPPAPSLTASLSIAYVPVSTFCQVAPAFSDRNRLPRSPYANTTSPPSGFTPKNDPSYGDGSSRQISPPSSVRYRCPPSAAMYSVVGEAAAILLRWKSPPSSPRAANFLSLQLAPPSRLLK